MFDTSQLLVIVFLSSSMLHAMEQQGDGPMSEGHLTDQNMKAFLLNDLIMADRTRFNYYKTVPAYMDLIYNDITVRDAYLARLRLLDIQENSPEYQHNLQALRESYKFFYETGD